jgi:hypothetical protein
MAFAQYKTISIGPVRAEWVYAHFIKIQDGQDLAKGKRAPDMTGSSPIYHFQCTAPKLCSDQPALGDFLPGKGDTHNE